ncbi:hypothetical protein LTR46_010280 [Exophiala xenobiotica]|nr:hypothetical protein LTR46_010280 [Exophiala xenobiotica]
MAAEIVNRAAWQTGPEVKPLEVGPGPAQDKPAADEVVIKVAYVAINPSEWKFQDTAFLPLQYPHVLGSDIAGEVVKIGEAVTRFKPGDRVIGHCLGLMYGGAKHGAFQKYSTCREVVVAKIPDNLPFAEAVVLPLALSTSIVALFELLQLELPSIEARSTSKSVLIWGGSSSVGTTAIQLAAAAGYKVITTASAKNHEYVKALGATEVFDHSDPDVMGLLTEALKGSDCAGVYDCIGTDETKEACAILLSKIGGGVLPVVTFPLPTNLPPSVKPVLVYATNPGLVENHVGARLWRDYVPAALETGKLRAKPEPKIITGGLEVIQAAMELQKKGVSAQKIVVEL